MPKSAIEGLSSAIRSAANDANPKATSREVAQQFYADYRELVAQFEDIWITEKLALLIGKYRASVKRAANPQLVMEGILGFKRLPARMEFAPGKTVRRPDATIEAFRRLASELRKQESPALEDARRAIALMSKYTPQKKQITWAEVCELEASKAKKAENSMSLHRKTD